ncbi:Myc target protein 1 -like protein [Takifugu flavidus]|uniref:Myc target protein 1-like protein n=1 Tax=Takifugu flavidus TaxID=433684 RepID=A0A5C6NPK2_9TELE|nr:Myc target protein 1 -like protein [Takifugu flavidus]
MLNNTSHPLQDTLAALGSSFIPLIVAFCVSMAVGLILGAVANVILTWMYRRKTGSARITRCPPHRSRTWWNLPGFNRSRSYDCHSNNSLDSQFTREADEGSQTCLSPTPTTSTGLVQTGTDCAATPPTLVSFWGNNNLRGFPNQSLLPAYEGILRAYDETCT